MPEVKPKMDTMTFVAPYRKAQEVYVTVRDKPGGQLTLDGAKVTQVCRLIAKVEIWYCFPEGLALARLSTEVNGEWYDDRLKSAVPSRDTVKAQSFERFVEDAPQITSDWFTEAHLFAEAAVNPGPGPGSHSDLDAARVEPLPAEPDAGEDNDSASGPDDDEPVVTEAMETAALEAVGLADKPARKPRTHKDAGRVAVKAVRTALKARGRK